MNPDLLLQRPDIWQGQRWSSSEQSVATGYPALDALLPGGGWPLGALTELLGEQEGIGALDLVMPAVARLSQAGRWVMWISPPYVPYAPALTARGVNLARLLWVHPQVVRDSLWTLEQALRSGTCGAVLAWLAQADHRSLRRLQLAAEAGQCWGLLFRPSDAAYNPSPAHLRLRLGAAPDGLEVQVLKRRGGFAPGPLHLNTDHAVAMPASAPAAPGDLFSRRRHT